MKSTPQVKVAEGLRALVTPEDILEAAHRLGALQRQRKVDMVALVESTVAAVSPVPGTQTTAFANYIALTGQKLSPSAFFERFSHAFGQPTWTCGWRSKDARPRRAWWPWKGRRASGAGT